MKDSLCKNIKKTYASLIALAGHSDAHVPQLTHLPASISRCPLFSEIAPTGQSGSQVPQFTHTLGSIFIAIISYLLIKICKSIVTSKKSENKWEKYELLIANKWKTQNIIFTGKKVLPVLK